MHVLAPRIVPEKDHDALRASVVEAAVVGGEGEEVAHGVSSVLFRCRLDDLKIADVIDVVNPSAWSVSVSDKRVERRCGARPS